MAVSFKEDNSNTQSKKQSNYGDAYFAESSSSVSKDIKA